MRPIDANQEPAFREKACAGRSNIYGTHGVCMLQLEVMEDLDNTISGRPGPGLKCLLDFDNIQTTLRLGFCQGSTCRTKKKILGAPCGGNWMECSRSILSFFDKSRNWPPPKNSAASCHYFSVKAPPLRSRKSRN